MVRVQRLIVGAEDVGEGIFILGGEALEGRGLGLGHVVVGELVLAAAQQCQQREVHGDG